MVGHILRHNRSYQKIFELIRQGVIGKLRLIHFVQNHHALDWERYKRLLQDCPPILDCGVHYLDVMQWMSQEKIMQINSWSCKLDADAPCDNFGSAQLTLSGGCKGLYESGWSKNLKAGNLKEFIGEKGYIRLTLCADRVCDKEEGDLIEIYHSDTGVYESVNLHAKYKDMNAQFHELVSRIEGAPHVAFTLEDAKSAFLAAVSAMEAMQKVIPGTIRKVVQGEVQRNSNKIIQGKFYKERRIYRCEIYIFRYSSCRRLSGSIL